MPIPENGFSEITINFVRPFSTSCRYDIIWVITDRLTNYVKIEPIKSTVTALEIANPFYQTWYRQFGLPTAITSDRDKLFIDHFWKHLMKKLDIHLCMSTVYYPETDGSSE